MSVMPTRIITHWPLQHSESQRVTAHADTHLVATHSPSLRNKLTKRENKETKNKDTFQLRKSVTVHSFATIVLWRKVQL